VYCRPCRQARPRPNNSDAGWVKVAIDAWAAAAGFTDGPVFRPIGRGDRVSGGRLGQKVVWQMLRRYAAEVGIPGIAPHDLRRTCAKLCRAAWPRLSPNDRALSRHQTGSGPCAERCYQVESDGIGAIRRRCLRG
jgi:integrase